MAIIPDSGVHLATDVRDVLNAAGGSVTNDVTSFFTEDAKINKWARYKPTIYPNLLFPDGTEEPLQWQASNGLCGFTEGSIVFNTVEDLVAAYDAGNTFKYDIPQGTEAEPMRLGDFRLHNTSAVAPIWDFYVNGAFIQNNNSSSVDFELKDNHGSVDVDTNLIMSDFMPNGAIVADWYFGIILVSGETYVKKSNSVKLGSDSELSTESRIFSMTYSEVGITLSDFKVYPCLYQYQNGKNGLVMALPSQFGGGEFTSGRKCSVVVEQPAVSWSSDTYCYTEGRVLSFFGVLGYDKDMEGKEPTVTITVTHSDGTTDSRSESVVLAHTDMTADGEKYRMDYSRSIIWAHVSGDEFKMVVSYSGKSSTSITEYKGSLQPDDL